MTLQIADDRVLYSAIVVEMEKWACNLDAQIMGQPEYVIIQPERDLAVDGSVLANEKYQFPQQSASEKHSKILNMSGLKISPRPKVPFK